MIVIIRTTQIENTKLTQWNEPDYHYCWDAPQGRTGSVYETPKGNDCTCSDFKSNGDCVHLTAIVFNEPAMSLDWDDVMVNERGF